MQLTDALLSAVGTYLISNRAAVLRFNWRVTEPAWERLGTGFKHQDFGADIYSLHVALKWHLSEHWSKSSFDEKLRVATWLIKDWGGIKRNASETIVGYVNQADAQRPATRFVGIASFSKVLSIKAPSRYAIFDARVSASLNAMQLLMLRDGTLRPADLVYFPMPNGQNRIIAKFSKAAGLEAFASIGFIPIERDKTYETYMALLLDVTSNVADGLTVLDAEMVMFVAAESLAQEALPLLQ